MQHLQSILECCRIAILWRQPIPDRNYNGVAQLRNPPTEEIVCIGRIAPGDEPASVKLDNDRQSLRPTHPMTRVNDGGEVSAIVGTVESSISFIVRGSGATKAAAAADEVGRGSSDSSAAVAVAAINIGGPSCGRNGAEERRVREEDADGQGGEGIDVDVLGGDTVSAERGIRRRCRLLRPGCDTESVIIRQRAAFLRLQAALQLVLQQELEEDAVELDGHARHLTMSPPDRSQS